MADINRIDQRLCHSTATHGSALKATKRQPLYTAQHLFNCCNDIILVIVFFQNECANGSPANACGKVQLRSP